MSVRPVILLGAVVCAAGLLVLQQAGVSLFPRPDSPFAGEAVQQAQGSGTQPQDVAQNAVAQNNAAPPTGGEPVAPTSSQAGERAAPASSGPVVDETALRYFAARGDTRRLEAEIARLKALYPQWTPPENPFAAAPRGDAQLDQMWKLYSEGKTAELRKAISDRRTREPDWQAPADLLDRLQLAEAREQLVNASGIRQYDAVTRIAAANPAMLTCGDVDVLWRVAEAFANTDRMSRSVDAYLYILHNCENPAERLATVQKAMALLPRAELDKLLAAERTVDGRSEFEAVRGEIARRAVVEADADPRIVVPAADLALVEKLAMEGASASDDLLLGWYHLRRENPKAAEDWFRRARAKQDDAAASQGLALALINQDRPQEAEEILYPWRDSGDDVRAVYLAAVANMLAVQPPLQIDPEILQRIVTEVAKAKDASSAQQLGWYADNFNQFETAARWFRTALEWQPDDEPSAYGLALMRWKLGDHEGMRDVQTAWAGRSERIPTVGERSIETGALDKGSRRHIEIGSETDPAAPRPVKVAPAKDAPAPVRPRADIRIDAESGPERESDPQAEPRQQAAVSYRVDQPELAPVRKQRAKGDRVRRSGCRTTDDPEGLSSGAALRRGWCLMDANRPIEAARAFEVALRGSGQTKSDAAYGQSLAYMRAGLNDKAAVAATRAPFSAQRSVEISAALLAARANSAYQNRRYVETLLALDERARIAPEQNDLMVLRGYAYLNLARYGDAERVFRAASATGNRAARRGLTDLWAARNPASNPY